jgi:MaoC like domain
VVPLHHALDQGPMIRALGGVARAALSPPRRGPRPETPGPWIEAEIPPRSDDLVRDYLRHVGGDPTLYRGLVPPHLFPQWGFPFALRTLVGLPYPYARAVNAGCRIDVRAPLPAGEPLVVRARLASIDDDGRRAVLEQTLVTGTRRVPEAMTAELRVHIPLGGKRPDGPRPDRARPSVPPSARSIATLEVGRRAGLDFALLTGDFNPIHWIRPWARIAGFRSTILHGFATLARACEALVGGPFQGDPNRLRSVDVRFTKPLVLPATISVYTGADGGLWVGGSPGGDAYLEGRFDTTETKR